MTPAANPGLWSDLSDLRGADACAALLKVNAEMFVAAPARDRDSIETFEALALGFLPKADPTTLREIARILAPCRDTPPSVLAYLTRGAMDSGGGAHRQAPSLRSHEARCLATPEGRAHLASRPDLDATSLEQLLVLREEASEEHLAANPVLSSMPAACHQLVRRAVERPALARILLQRNDLSVLQEACLYLAASNEQRRAVRQDILQHVPRIAASSVTLPEHDIAALIEAAGDRDLAAFERRLTEAFGFPAGVDWRILQIGRHTLLPLALKALGVPRREAARIFLSLHPSLSYPLSAIRALMREMRDVPGPVALTLVEAILGAKAIAGEGQGS